MAELPKTGQVGGKPSKENEEDRKLNRPLHRQYEAADAIAAAGYKVVNNPNLTEADRLSGLQTRKTPDYRIEGLIFDCYSPDPPVVAYARATEYVRLYVEPPNEDPWDWDDLLPEKDIRDHARSLVLESVRSQIGKKVHERQAFNIVLNLTDVVGLIRQGDVEKMLHDRGVERLGYVLAVQPGPNPAAGPQLTEQISGVFRLYENAPVKTVQEMYYYTLMKGSRLVVAEIHSPGA